MATQSGFTLGETEALLWGGKERTAARSKAVKDALVQSLKKAGFSYEAVGEKKTDDGLVTFFVAGKAGAGQATLGFFVASDTYLVLAWGAITPQGAAKTEAKDEPAPVPKAQPERPAAKPAPAEQKRLDGALEAAIEEGKAAEVKALLAQGANPNAPTEGGQSMLLRGVIRGGKDVVAALLEAGADPDKGNDTLTPLYSAALLGKLAIVDVLLEKGAKINAKTPESSQTALHGAAIGGHADIAKRLLERGADVNIRTKADKTALQIAEQLRQTAVADLLREATK